MGTFTEVRFVEVGPSLNCLSPSVPASLPPSCRRCSVSWSWSPSWHRWPVVCTPGPSSLRSLATQQSCLTALDTALVDSDTASEHGAMACHTTAMVLEPDSDTSGRQVSTPPASGMFTNLSRHPNPSYIWAYWAWVACLVIQFVVF